MEIEESKDKIQSLAERVKFQEQNIERQKAKVVSSSKCCMNWIWDGTAYVLYAAFRHIKVIEEEDDKEKCPPKQK